MSCFHLKIKSVITNILARMRLPGPSMFLIFSYFILYLFSLVKSSTFAYENHAKIIYCNQPVISKKGGLQSCLNSQRTYFKSDTLSIGCWSMWLFVTNTWVDLLQTESLSRYKGEHIKLDTVINI